jgi:hypothetical protein
LPFSKQKKKDHDDLARERFHVLDEEKKIEIVRNSLILLVLKDENLFEEKEMDRHIPCNQGQVVEDELYRF